MFFVVFFTCCLLHSTDIDDYCYALDADTCDYDFYCIWDGTSTCEGDETADLSLSSIDCTGKSNCQVETYYYNDRGATIYATFSSVKGPLGDTNGIDWCSLDYAIENDVYGNTDGCNPTTCGLVDFGTTRACFDFCWANPEHASCSATPCTANSPKVCCAIINTYACTDYCTSSGSQSTCCGGPATYTTTLSTACQTYLTRNSFTTDLQYSAICAAQPSNLTACALCSSYYECCSQYKKVVGSAAICDDFCSLKPSDPDCEKRKKCIENLGHEPSDAELASCGTTMVRLSSFTVTMILGVIAFFFLR